MDGGRLKALTKDEWGRWSDPTLNKIYGLDMIIHEAQIRLSPSIDFNPPMILPKKVIDVFSSSPYNYAITSTNLPNQMVSLTRIVF